MAIIAKPTACGEVYTLWRGVAGTWYSVQLSDTKTHPFFAPTKEHPSERTPNDVRFFPVYPNTLHCGCFRRACIDNEHPRCVQVEPDFIVSREVGQTAGNRKSERALRTIGKGSARLLLATSSCWGASPVSSERSIHLRSDRLPLPSYYHSLES